MWGTSWANIMLTMIDAQRTDYHSNKKQGNTKQRSNNAEVLDLSDPTNVEFLKKLAQ